jgi:hypothetical protein
MELIVAWQNPSSRRWRPIARLSRHGNEYSFRYVEGVNGTDAGMAAILPGMDDVHVEYRSRTLFPFFQNRLYNRKRTDRDRYREWLGLTREDMDDPLVELAASGAGRATDGYQVLKVPEPVNGSYVSRFFVHGTRYVLSPNDVSEHDRFPELKNGERLFLQLDIQNVADPGAMSLRTETPKRLIGFVPRLMDADLQRLINTNGPDRVVVTLAAVLEDAPLNLRYRCHIESPWPERFVPYSQPEFQPIRQSTTIAFVA